MDVGHDSTAKGVDIPAPEVGTISSGRHEWSRTLTLAPQRLEML